MTPGHREMKFARTRLSMLDALLNSLETRSLEETSVQQIADNAGVSYATFFNYFTRKDDLLLYFVQLWSIDCAAHARARELRGLRAIEDVFYYTAAQCAKSPGIMAEIVAYQALRNDAVPPEYKPLTQAEKILRYPHIEAPEQFPDRGLLSVFGPFLEQAREDGEIPRTADIQAVAANLAVIFLGVPAALGRARSSLFESVYRQHLGIFWKGIQGGTHASRKKK